LPERPVADRGLACLAERLLGHRLGLLADLGHGVLGARHELVARLAEPLVLRLGRRQRQADRRADAERDRAQRERALTHGENEPYRLLAGAVPGRPLWVYAAAVRTGGQRVGRIDLDGYALYLECDGGG